MTLFKKVFDSHFTDDVDEVVPAPSRESSAQLAAIPSETAPEKAQSFAAHFEDHRDDDILAEQTQSGAPSQTTAEPEELSMAQRAALAHAQMRPTQTAQPKEPERDEFASLRSAAQPVQTELRPPAPEPEQVTQAEPTKLGEPESTGRRGGRVKTRLLGFHQGTDIKTDPFQDTDEGNSAPSNLYPTGWLVVVDGPGEGNAMPIYSGVSTLGRGDDQALKLDFGDTSISRQNHAAIAYDLEQNKFFLGHGGKSNIIRLNDRPVLSTEELSHCDILRIGETTLRFVALCGADFKWDGSAHGE